MEGAGPAAAAVAGTAASADGYLAVSGVSQSQVPEVVGQQGHGGVVSAAAPSRADSGGPPAPFADAVADAEYDSDEWMRAEYTDTDSDSDEGAVGPTPSASLTFTGASASGPRKRASQSSVLSATSNRRGSQRSARAYNTSRTPPPRRRTPSLLSSERCLLARVGAGRRCDPFPDSARVLPAAAAMRHRRRVRPPQTSTRACPAVAVLRCVRSHVSVPGTSQPMALPELSSPEKIRHLHSRLRKESVRRASLTIAGAVDGPGRSRSRSGSGSRSGSRPAASPTMLSRGVASAEVPGALPTEGMLPEEAFWRLDDGPLPQQDACLRRALYSPWTAAGMRVLIVIDVVLVMVRTQIETVDLVDANQELASECSAWQPANANANANASHAGSAGLDGARCGTETGAAVAAVLALFSAVEIAIFLVFLVEHLLVAKVHGFWMLFGNWMYAVDFVVILASVAAEAVSAALENAPGTTAGLVLLVIVRGWRFVRLVDYHLLNRHQGILLRESKRAVQDQAYQELLIGSLIQAGGTAPPGQPRKNIAFDFSMAMDALPVGGSGKKKIRELKRQNVECGVMLGEGKFGCVYDGIFKDPETGKGGVGYPVAVKEVRTDAPYEANLQFVAEAALMTQLEHPNVVRMIGVVTRGVPMLVVLEYCSSGSLLGYLHKGGHVLTADMRTHMCSEMLDAMVYLASCDIVHCDIAARNVLLTNSLSCKVSDFGLSVFLPQAPQLSSSEDLGKAGHFNAMSRSAPGAREDKVDHVIQDQRVSIPIRWAAPECVQARRISEKSDVWSFGVLITELLTNGQTPYSQLSMNEVITLLQDGRAGGHPDIPATAPEEIREALAWCFRPDHLSRATFKQLQEWQLFKRSDASLHNQIKRSVSRGQSTTSTESARPSSPRPRLVPPRPASLRSMQRNGLNKSSLGSSWSGSSVEGSGGSLGGILMQQDNNSSSAFGVPGSPVYEYMPTLAATSEQGNAAAAANTRSGGGFAVERIRHKRPHGKLKNKPSDGLFGIGKLNDAAPTISSEGPGAGSANTDAPPQTTDAPPGRFYSAVRMGVDAGRQSQPQPEAFYSAVRPSVDMSSGMGGAADAGASAAQYAPLRTVLLAPDTGGIAQLPLSAGHNAQRHPAPANPLPNLQATERPPSPPNTSVEQRSPSNLEGRVHRGTGQGGAAARSRKKSLSNV